MLVINPSECIDCGVCVPACPIDAIQPDTEPGAEDWVEMNATYAGKWPRITLKKPAPDDAEDWSQVEDKYPKYFSEKPGQD